MLKNAAMYTNAVLRRKFGANPTWRDASKSERLVKAGAGYMLRKIGVLDTLKAEDIVSFKVDKAAPDYVRDVEPYQRAF